VRCGKTIEIELADGLSKADAGKRVKDMCEKLLANTVVERYSIEPGLSQPVSISSSLLSLVITPPTVDTSLPMPAMVLQADARSGATMTIASMSLRMDVP